MAILETNYKDDLSEQEAIDLCIAAIEAGIYHDLGSGSNVDVCVIKRKGVEFHRNIRSDNHKMFSKPDGYKFDANRVQVIDEFKQTFEVVEGGPQPMEL